MYPTRKRGKIIYESKLGAIERYFEKGAVEPRYIFHDKAHKGKINSKWTLKGFRQYSKYLRNFYKNETKLNRHNMDALNLCYKTLRQIDEFDKKLNYIDERQKKHNEQVKKDKYKKMKKQEEWKKEITIKRKEKKERQRLHKERLKRKEEETMENGKVID